MKWLKNLFKEKEVWFHVSYLYATPKNGSTFGSTNIHLTRNYIGKNDIELVRGYIQKVCKIPKETPVIVFSIFKYED